MKWKLILEILFFVFLILLYYSIKFVIVSNLNAKAKFSMDLMHLINERRNYLEITQFILINNIRMAPDLGKYKTSI